MMNVIFNRVYEDKKVLTDFCTDVCAIHVLLEESSVVLYFDDGSKMRGDFELGPFNIIQTKLERAIADNEGWIDLRTNGGLFNKKRDDDHFASDNSGFPEGW